MPPVVDVHPLSCVGAVVGVPVGGGASPDQVGRLLGVFVGRGVGAALGVPVGRGVGALVGGVVGVVGALVGWLDV